MASDAPAGNTFDENNAKFILGGYKYVVGTIDFAAMGRDNNLSVEACRKRFKRFFTKHNIDASIHGDSINGGSQQNATTAPATPTATDSISAIAPDTGKASKRKAKTTKTPTRAKKNKTNGIKDEEEDASNAGTGAVDDADEN